MKNAGSQHTESEIAVELCHKEAVAHGVVRLTLRRPRGQPLPEWEPGAHVDLVLPGGPVRQYSLCGDPNNCVTYQVAVLREAMSRGGSAYIHDMLSVADQLSIKGPRNNFRLVEADRYLFIGGGIGITPLIPMIANVASRQADWRLVYGGRSRHSMAFADELATTHGRRVLICPQDETGLLELDTLLAQPCERTAIYCCGPEPLLMAMERHCRHWPPGALHTERFAPKPDASVRERGAFEVELRQSGITLMVPANKSILEMAQEAGVCVLSSCREGTCGTCEVRVISGVIDHRDCVLTDDERATGKTMMICVSRTVEGRLVLDL